MHEPRTEVMVLGTPVVNITSMTESAEEERRSRTQRYLIMMAIRTICLILMVFVRGWWLWVVAAVAIFMPWIAVVLANHVSQRRRMPVETPHSTAVTVYREPISADAWFRATTTDSATASENPRAQGSTHE